MGTYREPGRGTYLVLAFQCLVPAAQREANGPSVVSLSANLDDSSHASFAGRV